MFGSYMDSFRPELETCPVCGSKGNCHIHAYYSRKIVDFIYGKPVRTQVIILRLLCESCTHTHAILPDIIIPYSTYSLFFLLRIMAEHFLGISTVDQLCERFGITRNQFYKWKALFHKHKQEWLGLLESMETSDAAFLKELTMKTDYSDFASGFFRKSHLSFLQSHLNPGIRSAKTADCHLKDPDP